jgi:hypothetical protein
LEEMRRVARRIAALVLLLLESRAASRLETGPVV